MLWGVTKLTKDGTIFFLATMGRVAMIEGRIFLSETKALSLMQCPTWMLLGILND